ncbi:uncharacterized protein LOC105170030 [Sesamum indicum]|uniref:Uncharacterized protein LOC105170030 n=1 Tax=Sesamum indicum TaxID=4182 RepID=A0A6I9TSZ3_SESIN|nr:uncharacterized protein LOC105170030 [Sesamum indicum]
MGINQVLVALFFFTLALANAESYTSHVLKGSVACLDCPRRSDLSGIQVLVKCNKVKKLAMAYTEEDGTFETNLPSDSPKTSDPSNCMAKLMGGPHQLYVAMKNSIVPVAKTEESGHFTTSKPLNFYRSCPVEGKCGGKDTGFDSGKTVDLPLPGEWGFPPTSYYAPYLPIIGIP